MEYSLRCVPVLWGAVKPSFSYSIRVLGCKPNSFAATDMVKIGSLMDILVFSILIKTKS